MLGRFIQFSLDFYGKSMGSFPRLQTEYLP
uniref:Uncharacterized protein n=2 Tax=unclassified Caudoviricetes TaxID=2788787 RepID=A0A8S5LGX9_9CAUD|nr:MAG TPA: hypothetical protein [Siphoviridae sp. ct5tj9]DAF61574.1 MAG TPA: hypothetical protein [Siphoviridae sp. ctJ0s2]